MIHDETTATFDPLRALPEGVYLIEASAGTGKTYQIGNVTVSALVFGRATIDQVLIVTFTRAATSELRTRILQRIVEGIQVFEEALCHGLFSSDSFFAGLVHQLQHTAMGLETALQRLELAREEFDKASIQTIHGFARQVLQQYAFESKTDMRIDFLSDFSALQDRLTNEWLLDFYRDLDPDIAQALEESILKISSCKALAKAVLELPNLDEVVPSVARRSRNEFQKIAKAWNTKGRTQLIQMAAQRFGGRESFGVKKDGKPGTHFAKKLNTIDNVADALLQESDPLSILNVIVTLQDLPHKFRQYWGDLAWDTIPGLQGLFDLLDEPRLEFIRFIHREMRALLELAGKQTYHDLLRSIVEICQKDPEGVLVQTLRGRFRAILIDEFQDTDPLQWELFSHFFGNGRQGRWLYLIGDPKQAIYRFRSADVYVYLEAKRSADQVFSMRETYRSDGRLVRAMNSLMSQSPDMFEQEGLFYLKMRSPELVPETRLDRPYVPIDICWVVPQQAPEGADNFLQPRGFTQISDARRAVVDALVHDIMDLLAMGPRILDGGESRPIAPSDCAVLVRTDSQARMVAAALRLAGIPSVKRTKGSVFQSDTAEVIYTLLQLMEQPSRQAEARSLAKSVLGPFNLEQMAYVEQDPELQEQMLSFLDEIRQWSQQVREEGFLATLDTILRDDARMQRIASSPDGERHLVDLRHLMELIENQQSSNDRRPEVLLKWLDHRIDEVSRSAEEEEMMRLETDDDAVSIRTLHVSKGLEFPFVFLPFGWSATSNDRSHIYDYHDAEGRRRLSVSNSPSRDVIERYQKEVICEELRLLYVGVTRGIHAVQLYWAHYSSHTLENRCKGRLTRLLFGSTDPELEEPQSRGDRVAECLTGEPLEVVQKLEGALDRLVGQGQEATGPLISWRTSRERRPDSSISGEPHKNSGEADFGVPKIHPVRRFGRTTWPYYWGVSSYSRMIRQAEKRGMRPETAPEQPAALPKDPSERELREDPSADASRDLRAGDERGSYEYDWGSWERPAVDFSSLSSLPDVPLAPFPAGPKPGSFVHEVLEVLDFQTGCEKHWPYRSCSELCREKSLEYGIKESHVSLLVDYLPTLLAAPLLPLQGAHGSTTLLRLQDLSMTSRLDELSFCLSIRGAKAPWLTLSDERVIGRQLSDIIAESTSPNLLPTYRDRLRSSQFILPDLAGYLVGFIDMVFQYEGRWYICDYKTNLIRVESEIGGPSRSTVVQYRRESLLEQMAAHNYYIQAQIYQVALHRYLLQELPNYDPNRDLGGTLYLFLRGLGCLDEVETSFPGVYYDPVCIKTLHAIDDLLGRGTEY